MTWHPATSQDGKPSTHLKEFAHDAGRLYIRFQNGAVHSYPAPDHFVRNMIAAPSCGSFFNRFVKPRKALRHEDLEVK